MKFSGWWRLDSGLLLILAVALVLRAVLAHHGGQQYYPDELRYWSSLEAVSMLREGKTEEAMKATFGRADHLGFRVLMMLPGYFQLKWDLPNWVMVLVASGIYSVLSIGLVYGIARRLGAGLAEARWAALCLAVTNGFFYWARHFMPYDLAMALGLMCMFVGVNPQARWVSSLLAGFLGFAAFVTYNGYWTLVAVALVFHVGLGWPSWKRLLVRAACGLIGLVAPMYALLWWSALRGYFLLDSYISFSGSINQGEFAEGHRVIVEYLWYAEHGLFVFWLACTAGFLVLAARRRAPDALRAWAGTIGVGIIVFSLVGFSVWQERFVVYGRLVRQLAPFFALVSGWMLARWGDRWALKPGRSAWLAGALIALGAANLQEPLRQRWDFPARAAQMQAAMAGQVSADGPIAPDRLRIISVGYIWPEPKIFDLPPHEVLLREKHPLQFEALLYEGFNRKQREMIRATDISDRLILLRAPAGK
jgi:hypothetical protein